MSFNPFKAVTRAIGLPDKVSAIVADVLPVTALFGAKPFGVGVGDVVKLGTGLVKGVVAPKNQNVTQSTLPQYLGHDPYNISFQAPSYQAPYYGGGGFDAYNLQPQQPYGGSPWGSSTMYSTPSIPQSPAYSAPQDRTWEDLTSLAGAALPFFL